MRIFVSNAPTTLTRLRARTRNIKLWDMCLIKHSCQRTRALITNTIDWCGACTSGDQHRRQHPQQSPSPKRRAQRVAESNAERARAPRMMASIELCAASCPSNVHCRSMCVSRVCASTAASALAPLSKKSFPGSFMQRICQRACKSKATPSRTFNI